MLVIKQQPVRGRMCGFSNLSDRRMLYVLVDRRDPPLVLQFIPEGSRTEEIENADPSSHYVCALALYDSTKTECRTTLLKPQKDQGRSFQKFQTLLGQTVQNATIVSDCNTGQKAIYFVFPDLSVRIQGEYTLYCQMINIQSPQNIESSIFTEPFTVYTPKCFPGMLPTTEMSKNLTAQGVPLRSRRFTPSKE